MDQVTQFSHRLQSITTRHLDYAKQRLTTATNRPLFQKPDQLYAPLREKLDRMTSDLQTATSQHHQQATQQLILRETQLNATLPQRLERATQQLKSATDRLAPTTNHQLAAHQQRLEGLTKQLESISPKRVLERGYSVTLDVAGQPITKVKQAATGEQITTILADGHIKSTVESTAATKLSSASKVQIKKKVRKKKRAKGDDQPKLF
jgi:exodeoxyribonuclease VII large subunit